ncbi:M20/M25/M40 family metallo-hydrolase [Gryllotalpicola ginsengisoli]|uniref:M20/M25/M40 family metallo-hydrolase n=1 Tax=Gryllotalpicola ginsengisoli TaxID=444608 RepID=UPI0003B557C5|nr:M20/M25/M40 family metallo-hydrolase [Gryllotalpicola ginsengisoli]
MTDAPAARPGIAERLSRLIRVNTVSAHLVEHGTAEFEAVLEELYPLVHQHLVKERIGERGLLFRWEAAAGGFETPAPPAPQPPSGAAGGFETPAPPAPQPTGAGRTSIPEERPEAASRRAATPAILMAHYDTVPLAEDDSWTHPPLSGAIEHGTVWGRGAIDDKGALVVLLDAVENLLAAGGTPKRPVFLSLGGDEETSGVSARAISEELAARGIRPWIVLDEGGAVVDGILPGLPQSAAVVGLGEKGVLSVRLTATAPAGHASTPGRARTAPERIARAVTRLHRNPFPKRLSRTSRQMFEAYRGHARGAGRVLIEAVPRLAPVSARLLSLLGGEPAAMVQTTVATTVLEGGGAHNVIPNSASAVLNLRIALGETVSSTLAVLRRAIGDPAISIEVIEGHDPSAESRTDTAQWRLIERAVGAAYPGTLTVPYVMMQASDARHFQPLAPEATYRFAPLAMSSEERTGLHGVNERVTVDALERGERFYRELIGALPAYD